MEPIEWIGVFVEILLSFCVTSYFSPRRRFSPSNIMRDDGKVEIPRATKAAPALQSSQHYQHEPECRNNINYFDHLPDELLLKIFSYISPTFQLMSLAKVCQRFHGICYDKNLWPHLHVESKDVSLSELQSLFSSDFPCEKLYLSLSPINKFGTPKFRDTNSFSPDFCKILDGPDDSELRDLGKDTSRVRIKSVELSSHKAFYKDWFYVTMQNEHLRALHLKPVNFEFVPPSNLQRILLYSSEVLKELDLTGSVLPDVMFYTLCHNLPRTLEKLVLDHVLVKSTGVGARHRRLEEVPTFREFLSIGYSSVFTSCTNLKYIGAPFLHIAGVVENIVNHELLETIRFCRCSFEKPDFYGFVAVVEPTLKKIDIKLKCPSLNQRDMRAEDVQANLDSFRKLYTIEMEAREEFPSDFI